MAELGKILVLLGVVMLVVGGLLLLGSGLSGKVPWIGRLPGDISIERDGFRFYFPLGTSLLLSILLTLILWLVGRR